MGAPIAQTAGFLPASPGTFDITVPGFGEVAGAILYVNNGRAGGADQGAIRGVTGMWTAGAQGCVGMSHNNNNATIARGSRNLSTTSIIEVYSNTGAGPQTLATASGITDGIRLNITTIDAARYYLCVLFSADEVGEIALTSTTPNTASKNVGFRPDFILAAHCGMDIINASETTTANYGIGICAERWFDGDLGQRAHFADLPTNDVALPITGGNYKTSTGFAVKNVAGVLQWNVSVSNFNSTGWTQSSTGPSDNVIMVLAVRWRVKRKQRIGANNLSAGSAQKVNENYGFTPLWSFGSNIGSGTALETYRTLDVNAMSFWSQTQTQSRVQGGFWKVDNNVINNATSSAGNTVRAIFIDPKAPYGRMETDGNTVYTADGWIWNFSTSNSTTGSQGWTFGVGEPVNGVTLGDRRVEEIYLGSTPVSEVWLGTTQLGEL
jgi:hypothetical protein